MVGIESRGFIFGSAVADRLGAGFAPVRKPGKLPSTTVRASYALEYGTDTLEMHDDAIRHGQRVLIVDDLLATGGTARATTDLVRRLGGTSTRWRSSSSSSRSTAASSSTASAFTRFSSTRVLLLAAALIAAAAALAGAWFVARAIEEARPPAPDRRLAILEMFAPALEAIDRDPRALVTWAPLARAARRLFAEDFASIEAAAGTAFPFGPARIEQAHARWTADWLAWELAHDGEYKLKAAALEAELAASGGAALVRARLEAVEREKLEKYQRRYEEYVRVAKALQALTL